MKKQYALILFLGALCTSSIGLSSTKTVSIGPKFSTLGAGFEVSKQINSYFKARSSMQGFWFNKTFNSNIKFNKKVLILGGNTVQFTFDGKLKLLNLGFLADFHPFQNGFGISTGLFYNENKVKFHAMIKDETIQIPVKGILTTYNREWIGDAKADITTNKISPYLGVRYETGFNSAASWSFNCELGVLYQGSPRVKLTYPETGTVVDWPVVQDQLKEEVKKLYKTKYMKLARFYPIVGIGVSYKF